MSPLRTIFMGTAELACPSLAALAVNPAHQVLLVVSQPDRPKGRSLKLHAPPVKLEAQGRGLEVAQPVRARHPEFLARVAELKPDLIVLAAYGQILPQALLDLPRFGCLNVHASLLPKYRGAAPIQWALLEDQAETGVTIMKMDPGLDTGPILAQTAAPISPQDNAKTLHDRLALLGAELLVRTIPDYVAGQIVPKPQIESQATYAPKLAKEDGRLDWTHPARALWNRVRALTPWPGAFTFFPSDSGRRLLKVHQAEVVANVEGQPGQTAATVKNELVVYCGQHALRLLTIQTEGGRCLPARDFLAGHPLPPGTQFDLPAPPSSTAQE